MSRVTHGPNGVAPPEGLVDRLQEGAVEPHHARVSWNEEENHSGRIVKLASGVQVPRPEFQHLSGSASAVQVLRAPLLRTGGSHLRSSVEEVFSYQVEENRSKRR